MWKSWDKVIKRTIYLMHAFNFPHELAALDNIVVEFVTVGDSC